MADNIVLLKIDVQEANANERLDRLRKSTKDLKEGSDEYVLVLKKIQIEEDRLANLQAKRVKIQDTSVKDTNRVTSALNSQKDATGSATAATMELSRIVSDAPYGIRGMANNITQLVSQLGTASTKAGGLGGALKLMIKQLTGPLGVVFAITAAVSALDYFYGANKKTEKSIKSVGESAAKSASALKILVRANDSGVMSQKETINAVKKANSQYKDLNIQVGANGKITDESVLAINRKISALEDLARATALQKLIEEEFVKLIPLQQSLKAQEDEALVKLKVKGIKTIEEAQDIADNSKDYALKGYVNGVLAQSELTEKEINGIQANIDKLIDTIPKVQDLFKDPKGGGGRKKTFLDPKEFEGDIFEVEKMLRQFRYKEVEESAKTATQKAAAKSLIELDSYKNEYKEFKDSENKKYELYLEVLNKQLSKGKITKESYDKALAASTEEKRVKDLDAYENYLKGMKGISDRYRPDIIGEDEGLEEGEQAKRLRREKYADIYMSQMLEKYKAYADEASKQLGGITDFIEGEFDRELVIQQNQTNALNNELNQRLLNENLSKEERKKIQNEIALNDEKLRVKQESIERKKFKAQKAANIAKALIDTASAAAGVMADAKGGFLTRLSQAIPTIAFGLGQVATIARTKFQSSAGATPPIGGRGGSGGSGGGDGIGDRSFDFNLVGNTLGNQITDAIQGQFDQPLRAYVVSRDITQQQARDENIRSSASF